MTKKELIEKFLEHIVTLSLSERRKFIHQLRTTQQCFHLEAETGQRCVLGAFVKSKGVKGNLRDSEDYCTTLRVVDKLKLPAVGTDDFPAMVYLNDFHNVTFPEFIKLIRSTMKARYFVHVGTGFQDGTAYIRATENKVVCVGSFTYAGKEVDASEWMSLRFCINSFKEVSRHQARRRMLKLRK